MLYTDFSNACAITGVCWILCSLSFSWESQPWGRGGGGGHVRFFPQWGLGSKPQWRMLQIKCVQISAWSLHTQNGMRSRPVAVFFRSCTQFHTPCLSEISGTWTPLSTWVDALISALLWFINCVQSSSYKGISFYAPIFVKTSLFNSSQFDLHWGSEFASRLRTRVFRIIFSFVNWILCGN